MFVFKIAQFFNPLNEIEAIDNAWVDDKNWFPKVNQKYLWISISKVEIRLGNGGRVGRVARVENGGQVGDVDSSFSKNCIN